MSRIIEGQPYVISVMERIKEERGRLENIVSGPKYEENPQWHWMEKWLKKTDEKHYKTWYDGKCNVCGKRARYFLKIDFSFCDEYGCGIQICNRCLADMQKIFKEGVKNINLHSNQTTKQS